MYSSKHLAPPVIAPYWQHSLVIVCALLLTLISVVSLGADKKQDNQQKVRQMSEDVLRRLYKAEPDAQKQIATSAGYAVFSNHGVKILVAGSGNGKGIAVNNRTKEETFMKMLEIQDGPGFGVKKFSVIFVFENQQGLNSFVNSGWDFGGQSTAAAKASDKGDGLQGAVSVSPGLWLYQLTDSGLALDLTAKGTRYYKDGDLN
jgi:lipid-binding SYLF domain-containing protein